LKYRWGQGKYLLRRAYAGALPREVWTRKKMGFGVPLGKWFREDLREMTHDVLLSEQALQRGYFRPEAVRQLVAEHESKNYDHSHRLWSLLFLELWLREWLDQSPALVEASASSSQGLVGDSSA
jgi:asparagine synthase (glutamine-hydrolysing)